MVENKGATLALAGAALFFGAVVANLDAAFVVPGGSGNGRAVSADQVGSTRDVVSRIDGDAFSIKRSWKDPHRLIIDGVNYRAGLDVIERRCVVERTDWISYYAPRTASFSALVRVANCVDLEIVPPRRTASLRQLVMGGG